MIKRTPTRTLVIFCLVAAIISAYSTVGLAAPVQGPSGELVVTGQVSVNGQNVTTGFTIFSDSNVTTAKGSSAVVSLGKLGRVEIFPDSTMRLTFTGNSVSGMLDAGRVRISTPAGVNASVMTRDGSAVADNAQENIFTVDFECEYTVVNVQRGRVELHGGDINKTVQAGRQESVGTPAPGSRCAAAVRPIRGDEAGDLSSSKVLAVLVGLGAVIAAIALVVSRGGDTDVTPPGPGNPSAIS
jgi:ferric-dicitrate binding protein FerR (iron transport regulator)